MKEEKAKQAAKESAKQNKVNPNKRKAPQSTKKAKKQKTKEDVTNEEPNQSDTYILEESSATQPTDKKVYTGGAPFELTT